MRASWLLIGVLLAALVAGGLWYALDDSSSSQQTGGLELGATPDEGLEPGAARDLAAEELSEGANSSESARSESEVLSEAVPAEERENQATRGVRGRVVDEFGAPVSGVRIFFAAKQGMPGVRLDEVGDSTGWIEVEETSSGADGRFQLDFKLRGSLSLALRHEGFAPLRCERELSATGETQLDDLVLVKGVLLAGHVVDRNGIGIAGAELHDLSQEAPGFGMTFFAGGKTALAVTDASGAFQIDELPAGPYSLRIDHEAHPSALASGHIARAGEQKTGERFQLDDGYEISGRLLGLEADQADNLTVRAVPAEFDFGSPLGGTSATRTAEVDDTGRFQLRGLIEEETYRVSAVETAGALSNAYFADPRSSVAIASAGDRDVELEVREPSALVFQVVDAKSGEPLTDFEVEAGSPWMSGLRDAEGKRLTHHEEGRVRFADVPMRAGQSAVDLRVRAEGYETLNKKEISMPQGQETNLGVLRMNSVPKVTVRVTDKATGEPVRGARVTLRKARERGMQSGMRSMSFSVDIGSDSEEETPAPFRGDDDSSSGRTDDAGIVELASLPGERVELYVRHKQFADHLGEPFTLSMSDDVELEAALTEGGTVTVTVLDSNGEPLEGVRVKHTKPGDDPNVMVFGGGGGARKSRNDGTIVYRNLAAGSHHFEISESSGGGMFGGGGQIVIAGMTDENEEAKGEDVLVSEGSESEVTLRAKPRGTLVGQVTESGEPLAGATLSLEEKQADEDAPRMRMMGFGGGKDVKTDSKGEYSFEDVKTGEYTVRITHPTRSMPVSYDVSVAEGAQTCNFPLGVTILEGRITDIEGNPVAGVQIKPRRARREGAGRTMMRTVMVTDSGGGAAMSFGPDGATPTAMTDENGEYSLRGVAPEVEIYIETSSDLYQEAESDPVIVGDGETRSGVDAVVYEAGSIEVRVFGADGEPQAFCMLRGVFEGDSEEPVDDMREFVGESGLVRLKSLHPGKWKLTAQGLSMGEGPSNPDDEPESEPVYVEVEAGEQASASLQLP